MKIRQGFVSNSSSSSFTCEICKEEYSGYDISFTEFDMVTCDNCGSYFDKSCLEKEMKISEEDRSCIEPSSCPVCNMKIVPSKLALKFFKKINQIKNENDLVNFIKSMGINSHEQLKSFLKQ